MDLLIRLILVIAVAYGAFWIIDSAFPEPIRLIAKIIVGVLVLAAVLPMLGVSF